MAGVDWDDKCIVPGPYVVVVNVYSKLRRLGNGSTTRQVFYVWSLFKGVLRSSQTFMCVWRLTQPHANPLWPKSLGKQTCFLNNANLTFLWTLGTWSYTFCLGRRFAQYSGSPTHSVLYMFTLISILPSSSSFLLGGLYAGGLSGEFHFWEFHTYLTSGHSPSVSETHEKVNNKTGVWGSSRPGESKYTRRGYSETQVWCRQVYLRRNRYE